MEFFHRFFYVLLCRYKNFIKEQSDILKVNSIFFTDRLLKNQNIVILERNESFLLVPLKYFDHSL